MPNSAIAIPHYYDYAPTLQFADPTALDTAIMATTPWAYWKMNESSGVPQDSSGNGRHATTGIAATIAYNQAAITAKAGPSMRLDGYRWNLPIPQGDLGSSSGTWTVMGLFYFETVLGTGSPGMPDGYGAQFMGQMASGLYTDTAIYLGFANLSNVLPDYTFTMKVYNSGGVGSNYGFRLNMPMVIVLMGSSISSNVWTFETWINGVKTSTALRQPGGSGPFGIGRCSDAARSFPKFRVSNVAMWNNDKSPRQILDLTECYMDKTAYDSGLWLP